MKILEEGKVAPSFRDWSVEEETALAKLEAEPVSIKDTVLCHLKEQHKRELLATYHAMSDMEKQAFMQELTGGQLKVEYLKRRRVRERKRTM